MSAEFVRLGKKRKKRSREGGRRVTFKRGKRVEAMRGTESKT